MVERFNPVTNTTKLRLTTTWFGSLSSYSIGYKYANQTLFTFLPLLLLLVFNSLLVRQVMFLISVSYNNYGGAKYVGSRVVALPKSAWVACIVTRTYSTFGDRAFGAAGPGLWNSLPSHLKDADLSYSEFRRSLKTFLFGQWGHGAV